ncbi:putrescine-ornithine antiporter [Actinobacillus delphinicola]|uniref:Putrescine transporter PotE n=1 Tax=Actinobacillus delphinicola TaxID=51161 RepID=A0A448TSN1_9PAST|nr:putrescine-ornithine antiporter [Actinobacillus delphinicola]MDG6897109.1 putrescine-ornithine antiporter [Actinobacillus delphinicola]VEJ08926.1 amino acid permease-associated protein [Actinobacillus delphinicola]
MTTKSNKMGVGQLTIITMVNMMGSGIIMLPTKLAQVGTISIVSWLVTALGSCALAYAFAQCGMFSKKTGGMGGYSEYSFGKSGNFLANYTYALSLLIANVAIAISAVGYAVEVLNVNLSPVQTAMWTIVVLWITTILNFWGARITGNISGVTVWGVIIPVVGVCIIGWFWFSGKMYVDSWNPHHTPIFEAISASISMTLWSFLGLESACANSDAVDQPEKNIPIAVLGATIGAAIIYIISTNVIAGIVPNMELAKSSAPFGLAFAYMFNPITGKIIMALMVIACIGSLLGWQFTIAQVFKASAEEGYFPAFFKKVTSKDAPIIGMIVLTIIQTLLSLMTISPNLYAQFNVLVNLAVVTNLVPYLLSMAALTVLLKLGNASVSKVKITTGVAFIGSLYSLYAMYASGEEAMFYGSLVTFIGWTLYGFISPRFDCKDTSNAVTENKNCNLDA